MTDFNEQHKLPQEFYVHNWGWLLGLGILFIILGTLGLGVLVGLTVFSMIFFGVLLIFGGISHVIDSMKYKKWKGAVWQVIIAILYFIAGGIIIYDPLLASTIITALLAIVLIILGTARIIMAIVLRDVKGWGWVLLAGFAALILGILILVQWPYSGLWIIGLFIAIELIITGWTYVLIALSVKRQPE